MDDLIANFTAVTGSTTDRASQYLKLTDGNLEHAIQLFFDSDGVDLEAQDSSSRNRPPTQTTQPQTTSRPAYEDAAGMIHVDSDAEISDDNDPEITGYNPRAATRTAREGNLPHHSTNTTPPQSHQPAGMVEDDEAMARRIQEELYAGGDLGGGATEDGVRAPIARTTETLVGPGSGWSNDPDEMRISIAEQMAARSRRAAGRPGIFNQREGFGSVWEDDGSGAASRRQQLSEATGGASETSSKSSMLAEMYRPPFDLISHLMWDDAREEGKENNKWILVNIQDPSIFDCQVLNRDIWKHPGVKETVKENFIFLQYSKDDPRANQYVQYYFQARDSQDAYPHIAIVDPRTGEQVKVWSGPPVPKPMDFLMQLHEFLDRYSLQVTAKNPIAKRKPEKKPVDVDRMTEEEMLEMAMQNSLANTQGPREDDPDALTRSVDDIGKGKGRADAVEISDDDVEMSGANETEAEAGGIGSAFSSISSTNPHTEPANDPNNTTRIQFRHSGGRIIRRFNLSEPVRRIYEWLKASPIDGKEGLEFELVFMGRNLIDSLDESIEQSGLKNGTVMVEFLE